MSEKDITVEEIMNVYGQLEKEIQYLTASLGQLKEVHDRWLDNVALLDSYATISAGTVAQIPLTESLFVSARLDSPSHVKVDLGTGYYADKTISEAQEYYQRRCKFALEQIGRVDASLGAKRRQFESVAAKLQLIEQQQLHQQKQTAS